MEGTPEHAPHPDEISVASKNPSYLRLHQESPLVEAEPETGDVAWIARLCDEFEAATGCPMTWLENEQSTLLCDYAWSAPVNPGVGTSPGYLAVGRGDRSKPHSNRSADQAKIHALASSMSELLSLYRSAERNLWEREAELAAGVPVVSRKDESAHLATRLTAVLKSGAESVGCQAAALYLLDADTTQLKLRTSWNIPVVRLLDPPRQLQGSLADLEAMAGSAVVLEDDLLHSYWKVPENYPAAVCLPVSSPSTILGTVWFFSDEERPFTAQQTDQLEIIAGRLAADLEREMLLADGANSAELKKDLHRAENLQASQSLTTAPDVDGWAVAAWQQQGESLGGAFHDWWMPDDERALITVGTALDGGVSAALVGASVKTALRAHGEQANDPLELLTSANRTLWTGSAGDQFASVLAAEIHSSDDLVKLAAGGQFRVLVVDEQGNCHWHQFDSVPLALSDTANFHANQWQLLPGSTLVAWTGFTGDVISKVGPSLETAVCEEMVAAHQQASVQRLAEVLHDLTNVQDLAANRFDHALLVLRRKGV